MTAAGLHGLRVVLCMPVSIDTRAYTWGRLDVPMSGSDYITRSRAAQTREGKGLGEGKEDVRGQVRHGVCNTQAAAHAARDPAPQGTGQQRDTAPSTAEQPGTPSPGTRAMN